MKSARRPLLTIGALPVSLYVLITLLAPVAVLIVYSFWQNGFFSVDHTFTVANYVTAFTNGLYLGLLAKSLGIGLLVAAVTIPIAFGVAYTLAFRFGRWGNHMLALIMVSMLSSYIVRIYAWKTILGPDGIVNQALRAIGLIHAPLTFLLYGNFALVVTLVNILLPYAVLPIYSALQNIDRDVLGASRDLGAAPVRTFWRVTLPLAMPGVSAAFLFCFILASADYVTPQLVGGTHGILVGRVIADQFGPAGNLPLGAALSVALLVGFAVVVALLRLLRYPFTALGRLSFGLSRPRRHMPWLRHVRSLPWAQGATIGVILFCYLPLIVVLVFSVNSGTAGVLPMRGISLAWYRAAITDPEFQSAVRASLLVGTVTVAGALLIGSPAAFALARRDFRARRLVEAIVFTPVALPGVVIGVALLSALSFGGLSGALAPTAAAHVLFTVPFVVLVLRASLVDLDWQVTEAARDLGSGPIRTLRTVTLPLVAASVVGAGILVFALSLDEFVITNFVVGTNTTLPVLIWSQMRRGISPAVNAISSLILLGSLTALALAGLVLRRFAAARRNEPEPTTRDESVSLDLSTMA